MPNRRAAWSVSEREFPADAPLRAQLAFLVRYAILAPSSHNTQPWKFVVDDAAIDVVVDDTRWLRIADADQRELYASVGCAIENLVTAGAYFGLAAAVGEPLGGRVRVAFTPSEAPVATDVAARFQMITVRHTNRRRFEPHAVEAGQLVELAAAVAPEATAVFRTDPVLKQALDALVARADAIQFADAAWRRELAAWYREAFGQPWPVAQISRAVVSRFDLSRTAAKRDHAMLMSAPAIGWLTAPATDRRARIGVGRAFQRMSLTAEAMDLRVHPMNQVLQVSALAPDLRLLVGTGELPQLMFRVGYAQPEKAHATRRPVEEVIATTAP